jgi:predicted methyltransferase
MRRNSSLLPSAYLGVLAIGAADRFTLKFIKPES